MKLCRCPVCHSNIHLDALTNDDAAKEMLTMLAPMDGGFARALVAYMGLFRPAKSDLSFSRAVKLGQEVLLLSSNKDWLRAALEETILKIQAGKLQAANSQGQARQLTNHNYLKKVLESVNQGAIEVPAAAMPRDGRGNAKPSIEIKSHTRPESLAETNAKFQAQMGKFLKPKTTEGKP